MKMKFSSKGSITRTGPSTKLPRVRAVVKNSFVKPTPKTRTIPASN